MSFIRVAGESRIGTRGSERAVVDLYYIFHGMAANGATLFDILQAVASVVSIVEEFEQDPERFDDAARVAELDRRYSEDFDDDDDDDDEAVDRDG